MLAWLTGRDAPRRTAGELYGRVVAEARRPAFYANLGVPDTPEGRFELIALHLFLVLERLRRDGSAGEAVSRHVLEAFVTDMDDCMREMGVGDLTVPKRVKRAAAGFYERAGVYRAGLDTADSTALAAAVQGYIFVTTNAPDAAAQLADYVRSNAAHFDAIPSREVLAGRVAFIALPETAKRGQP
jgi:cytochrome b pre-mRNA-processing protein 3